MAYMLLIHEPRGQRDQRSEEEGREAYAEMMAFGQSLAERNLLVAAESLMPDTHSVCVEVRDNTPRFMDGPFTETREMLGGFFLLNTDNRETALLAAQECPAARFATVEVRRVAPCYET